MTMWIRCALLTFGCCMSMRMRELPPLVRKNTVEVVLSLSDPEKGAGNPIELAVDGVRQLAKIHTTELGKPVVFHHIANGSVVTAHVGTWGACAYYVTPGVKQCTVGEWEVSLTTVAENEDAIVSQTMYEAYVRVVGWGSLVTLEINGNAVKTFDSVAQNETFRHAGLQNGDPVRAVSNVTGDSCLYRVGNAEMLCHLDGNWGLLLGSIKKFDEDHADEGVISIEVKKYTVDFGLERDDSAARKLDIRLNGQLVASKMEATEVGKSIIVHHVKGGSVFTALAPDNRTACCIYVGAGTGMQSIMCAGWTMKLNIKEEHATSFENRESFDVGFSVHRGSKTTNGTWGLDANGKIAEESNLPRLFPGIIDGYARGDKIVPFVDKVLNEICAHVVGGNETKCQFKGWNFTIWSILNMNSQWDGDYWDWDNTDLDINIPDPETFNVRVTAIDYSDSPEESTLECIANQDLHFYTVPSDETDKRIRKGKKLFQTKVLTLASPESVVKSAEFVGQFPWGMPFRDGFACTIYKEESIMCEATSNGGLWTYNKTFSLEIMVGN